MGAKTKDKSSKSKSEKKPDEKLSVLSPTHQHRIQRQQYFESRFLGVKARVLEGESFVSSEGFSSKVKHPKIFAQLGIDLLEGSPGTLVAGTKDKWLFDTTFEFPYKGELRLRFIVRNEEEHIGFHDINLFDHNWDHAVDITPIILGGPAGPAGTLRVAFEPIEEPLYSSPASRRANGELIKGFGMTSPSTRAVSPGTSLSSSISSSALDFIQDRSKYGNLNLLEVELLGATGLKNAAKAGSPAQDIYVVSKVGKNKLESSVFRGAGVEIGSMGNDTFVFPYKGESTASLKVYADLKMKNDPCLGSIKYPFADALFLDSMSGNPQSLKLPLLDKEGMPAGHILMNMQFRNEVNETEAHLRSTGLVKSGSAGSDGFGYIPGELAGAFKTLKLTILNTEGIAEVSSLTPYVKARVGGDWLRTVNAEKSTSVSLFGESFYWPYDGRRSLRVEVWDDKKMRGDKMLGESMIRLDGYLAPGPVPITFALLSPKTGTPAGRCNAILEFSEAKELIPRIEKVGGSALAVSAVAASVSPNSRGISTEIEEGVFAEKITQPSLCQTLRISLKSAEGLKKKKMDTLDPYVVATLGDATLKSPSYKDSGCNPLFSDMFIYPYRGHQNLRLDVYDKAHMTSDPHLGGAIIDLQPYVIQGEIGHTLKAPLVDKKGGACGFLNIGLECVHSATESNPRIIKLRLSGNDVEQYKSLQVFVIGIDRLTTGEKEGDIELDSYVIGKFHHDKRRTETTHNSTHPQFSDVFQYAIKDPKKITEMEFNVYSNANNANDKKLATATVDLASWAARGADVVNVPLTHKKLKQGMLNLGFRFTDSPFSGEEVLHLPPGTDIVAMARGAQASRAALAAGPELGVSALGQTVVTKSVLEDTMSLTESGAPGIASANYNSEALGMAVSISSGSVSFDGDLAATAGTKAVVYKEYVSQPESGVGAAAAAPRTLAQSLALKEWTQKVDFQHPYNSLRVNILKGCQLANPHMVKAFDKIDPYVVVTLGPDTLKTEEHHDSGPNPTWKEALAFPYHGIKAIKIDVFDDATGKDPLVGSAVVGLEEHVRAGMVPTRCLEVPLSSEKGKPAGMLFLNLSFMPDRLGAPQVEKHQFEVPAAIAAKIAADTGKKKSKK